MIAAVARQQVVAFTRQRMSTITIATLGGFAALAGFLGWASHHTIVGVYDESVALLTARGQSAPPNPFLLQPSLSMLSNEMIYITMVGALVAIMVGHLALADDDSGIGRLVFTRPISKIEYTKGKTLAIGTLIAGGIAVCFVVSLASLAFVNQFPPGPDLLRLTVFYLMAWTYLMVFALVGAITVLITRRRSLGLLAAIGVWLTITFALPQFTSGLRPSQSLNPIVDPVPTNQAIFRISSRIRPLSINEQFKAAASRVLAIADPEPTSHTLLRFTSVVVALLVLVVITGRLVVSHDYSRSASE